MMEENLARHRPSPKAEAYVGAVEIHSGRRFKFREEITLLVDTVDRSERKQVFEELTFVAKFVSSAEGILTRLGPGSEQTEMLAAEFHKAISKSADLLESLLTQMPEETRESFKHRFLSSTAEGGQDRLALLAELSCVKNYTIDHETFHP